MPPRLRLRALQPACWPHTWAVSPPPTIGLSVRARSYEHSSLHAPGTLHAQSGAPTSLAPTASPYSRHEFMACWHKASREVSPADLRYEGRDEIDAKYVIITQDLKVEKPAHKLRKNDIISRYGLCVFSHTPGYCLARGAEVKFSRPRANSLPRDLKALDSHILDVRPSLLIGRRSIVLCTPIARAVITHDRMVVVTADRTNPTCSNEGMDEMISTIVDVMRYLEMEATANLDGNDPRSPRDSPFELRALEAILLMTERGFKSISSELHARVYSTIPQLRFSVDALQLHDLLEAKRMCEDTLFAGRALQSALSTVLSEDEDLAAMYITDKIEGHARATEDHQSAELLLEYYERRLDETNEAASRLSKMLVDIDSGIALSLASSRLRMGELDVQTAIFMSALTAGAVVAGLFGMNLENGWEQDPVMFRTVTTSICATMSIIFALGWTRFNRARKSQLMLRHRANGLYSGNKVGQTSMIGRDTSQVRGQS
ncbi:BZ3500_MvSof-1268-A1-R1_Chr2-1g04299 [Microbotryum saponariae]|uniref:Magnesium transporter n=1 Tax=Microbotryum saponariae TaxID=289078 RepID=A0A2X0M2C0_9BASI|nr:BZ3500_MvSof-1268-A1-R1_Chr2-1g04299 [Microbotryum saponariae]SCZ91367.1 BZ3501_MvSof-1269-A2-R1_Chr2-1g03955 [Microbotryum saponariae]